MLGHYLLRELNHGMLAMKAENPDPYEPMPNGTPEPEPDNLPEPEPVKKPEPLSD
ncbi:hypothetical protein ACNVED_04650 [Legionella sp. D16C41]|uniref:hypothetical protein n=1 Tax=Legionella sp. D16C41 TaxID=3402688 RepID=UPI003AF71DC0